MNKKMTNYIIFFSWFLFLVLLWIVVSLFKGENGQWWSIYRLNADKYGLWALEISYTKFSIAALISLAIAYMVSFGFKRKR
jgi:ABC-type sulfate transport system permease component